MGDPQPHGAGGEIDVVGIFGPGRIGLRTTEAPESLQLIQRLITEQILDRVEYRACVRLHGNPVLGP